MACCSNETVIYIEGSYVCANCHKNRTGEYLLSEGYDFTMDLHNYVNKKCECGAERVYGDKPTTTHAFYCPKYKKP